VITTIDKALGLIGLAGNWKQEHYEKIKTQKKIALESLISAVSETRKYLAVVRTEPTSRDKKQEEALAGAWHKAAKDMWFLDGGLGSVYLSKADYWLDPEGWTLAEKNDAEIQLDALYSRGKDALKP